MPYLLTHYAIGDMHHCRLSRENEHTIEHVLSAFFTEPELAAFIEMVRKLDPHTRVEQTRVPEKGQGRLPLLNRKGV